MTRLENAIERGDGSVRPRAGTSFHLSTSSWPTIIWYGGEPIEMWHQPSAHSDGDLVVFFRKSDVIAAGDVITVDRYPFIDAKSGGSIQGIIDALNWIVATAVPEYNQQGGTRVIPGHGRILNQTDVVEYRDMATIVRDRIAMLAKEGKTLQQVKAEHPTLDYDGNYGSTTGPLDHRHVHRTGVQRRDGEACQARRKQVGRAQRTQPAAKPSSKGRRP